MPETVPGIIDGHWSLDRRVPIALIVTIALQSAAMFMWVGALTSRVFELEAKAVRALDASDRVIGLEAEMREVRRVLQRIETKLDRRAMAAPALPRAASLP